MFAVVGVSCKLFFSIFVPWPCGFINLKLGTLCLLFKKLIDGGAKGWLLYIWRSRRRRKKVRYWLIDLAVNQR
jgi:hypothetical protein